MAPALCLYCYLEHYELNSLQWLLGKEVERSPHIFCLVFSEEFFVDFRTRSMKGSYTSSNGITYVLIMS